MVELIPFVLQQRFVNFLLTMSVLLISNNSFLSSNDVVVVAFVVIPSITCARSGIEIETRDLQNKKQQDNHHHQQQGTIILTASRRSSLLSSRLRNNDYNQSCNPTICLSQQQEEEEEDLNLPDRRNILFRMGIQTSLLITTMMAATVPSPALALKQKNEALCGTGFFEHIYEYKCTSIGDIEDEGTSKKLLQAEMNLADNLMGKLGFDTDDVIESTGYNNKSNNNINNNNNEMKKKLENEKENYQ